MDPVIPYRPDPALLSEFAPADVWALAFAQAETGPLRRWNTGAVLFDLDNGRILSYGQSRFAHGGPGAAREPAMHAEANALDHAPRTDLSGAGIVVVGVKAYNGGHCTSSQPCIKCLRRLANAGVSRQVFIERSGANWHVHDLSVAEHYEKFSDRSEDVYGRLMRLPRLTPA